LPVRHFDTGNTQIGQKFEFMFQFEYSLFLGVFWQLTEVGRWGELPIFLLKTWGAFLGMETRVWVVIFPVNPFD
jgi:hypothetical protein